jgi:hypothetical protein
MVYLCYRSKRGVRLLRNVRGPRYETDLVIESTNALSVDSTDRDLNAAINIETRGVGVGVGVPMAIGN